MAKTSTKLTQSKLTVPSLVVEMKDWFTTLERAVAGYNCLHQSLLSFQGQLPDGERKKGLPIFRFTTSVDGHTPIEVVLDLKLVNPDYITHVLAPLINTLSASMLESLEEIAARINMLLDILKETQEAVND